MQRLIQPQNLTTLAYDSIKRYILAGKLPEGARITEEFIAGKLGISKSPVREALSCLQAEGLIRIEPRRGAYLCKVTLKEVSDLYGLREELESYAVRTAQLKPELFTVLRKSIAATRTLMEDNEKLEFIEEDVRFHGAIAEAAGNPELSRVLQNLQHRLWLCRCETYNISSSQAADAHEAILCALESGDRTQADIAMRQHIRQVRQLLSELLET